ncbi:MAG TPA: amidohydrolase, partial [Pirellulaceae bacterium]
MTEWLPYLRAAVDAEFPSMVELRRHLHRNPEPSGEEQATSQLLYGRLLDAGFEVRQGPNGCGVWADYFRDTPRDPPIFALRADIDALRIQDEKTVEYRSTKPQLMHACGHDAHTSIVFGALLAIRRLDQAGHLSWPPRLRGIFQPAEETSQGACQMIESGALEGIRAIIATHVDPSRRLGRLGLRSGVLTAS